MAKVTVRNHDQVIFEWEGDSFYISESPEPTVQIKCSKDQGEHHLRDVVFTYHLRPGEYYKTKFNNDQITVVVEINE